MKIRKNGIMHRFEHISKNEYIYRFILNYTASVSKDVIRTILDDY